MHVFKIEIKSAKLNIEQGLVRSDALELLLRFIEISAEQRSLSILVKCALILQPGHDVFHSLIAFLAETLFSSHALVGTHQTQLCIKEFNK